MIPTDAHAAAGSSDMGRCGICVLMRALWLSLLLIAAGAASARTVLELDGSRQPVALADWGDVWTDATGRLTAEQVVALNPPTQPTREGAIHPLRPGQALWIRFSVPAAPDHERWYLKLPNAGLDRVTLYTRQDRGWTAHTAGDQVPVSQWPIPHLYPLLPLSVSAADTTYYLLRIEASNSFSTPLRFVSESHVSVEQQRISLLHGLYFGLLAMVTVFAMANAVVMRDGVQAWFGLFALLVMGTVANWTGVAGLHLWPDSPAWNDAAEYVLPTLALAPLLVFIAQAVSLRARSPRLYALCIALAVLAVPVAVACGLQPSPQRLWLSLASIVLLSATGLLALAWAWRLGDRFARWLLLAFVPMLLALPFPIARSMQWLPLNLLTQHGMQMALALTLPALLYLLLLRSHERRDYRRRITQLDQVDPMTGLVNDEVFMHRLRGLIDRSRRFGHESALVLVDITNMHRLREEFGRKIMVEVLLRLAGRLASMVRDVDTVARLGDGRFGLLIEGPVPAQRGAALGSKVLARLIMPFSRLPQGLTVRPKVAVALVPTHGTDPAQVVERLDAMLKEAAPDHRKTIFVIDTQPAELPSSEPAG